MVSWRAVEPETGAKETSKAQRVRWVCARCTIDARGRLWLSWPPLEPTRLMDFKPLKSLSRSSSTTYVLAAGVLGLDYLTGPHIRFPIVFVAPVALAAWQHGRLRAFVFASALPLVRLWFWHLWGVHSDTLTY